eukprot:scaffold26437_cov120-Isochrysis_galbana.AAC.4
MASGRLVHLLTLRPKLEARLVLTCDAFKRLLIHHALLRRHRHSRHLLGFWRELRKQHIRLEAAQHKRTHQSLHLGHPGAPLIFCAAVEAAEEGGKLSALGAGMREELGHEERQEGEQLVCIVLDRSAGEEQPMFTGDARKCVVDACIGVLDLLHAWAGASHAFDKKHTGKCGCVIA